MSSQFMLITICLITRLPLYHSQNMAEMINELMKDYNITNDNYNPNYGYEPYWADGNWVFKEEELPPNVTTTPIPQVCGEECNYLYTRIGEVCARQTSNTQYDGCWDGRLGWFCYGDKLDDYTKGFRTFSTYCKFLDAQCRSKFSSRWILVHSGPCVTNQNLIFKPILYGAEPVSRMRQYFTRLGNVFDNMTLPPLDLDK